MQKSNNNLFFIMQGIQSFILLAVCVAFFQNGFEHPIEMIAFSTAILGLLFQLLFFKKLRNSSNLHKKILGLGNIYTIFILFILYSQVSFLTNELTHLNGIFILLFLFICSILALLISKKIPEFSYSIQTFVFFLLMSYGVILLIIQFTFIPLL